MSLLKAFERIKRIRNDQDPIWDLMHAAEELGEVAKELRNLQKNRSDTIYEAGQEESLDLAICAIALYIGFRGQAENIYSTVDRKLDKWEQSLTVTKEP